MGVLVGFANNLLPWRTCARVDLKVGRTMSTMFHIRPNCVGVNILNLNRTDKSIRCRINSMNSLVCTDVRAAVFALETKIKSLLPERLELIKKIKSKGTLPIGNVTPNSIVGGMRGLTVLLTDTSYLDEYTGVKYRDISIDDLITKTLPKASLEHQFPTVESLIWFLMTCEIPTFGEVELLRKALYSLSQRGAHDDNHFVNDDFNSPVWTEIPSCVIAVLSALPKNCHPMTQLMVASASLSDYSLYKYMYKNWDVKKQDLWKFALFDALSLIAKIPVIASYIYRRSYCDGVVPSCSINSDYAENLSQMLGFDSPQHSDFFRLYLILHADHEGGNASAHAAHLVGSTHADIFSAYAAGMAGLSGPLHGLATQECLIWLKEGYASLKGKPITKDAVAAIARESLALGRVIPGFGHAVLRVTDPRFTAQREFALKHMPNDTLFQFLEVVRDVVPQVLSATGKVKNPHPNVDCHSGVLLQHFGLKQEQFYTVLFGVARCIGIASQYLWARALNLPIERPKSITLTKLNELCNKNAQE